MTAIWKERGNACYNNCYSTSQDNLRESNLRRKMLPERFAFLAQAPRSLSTIHIRTRLPTIFQSVSWDSNMRKLEALLTSTNRFARVVEVVNTPDYCTVTVITEQGRIWTIFQAFSQFISFAKQKQLFFSVLSCWYYW